MANLSHLPEQWRKSGLTQREFCDREGIKLATFSYWRSKELRKVEQQLSTTQASSFTEVIVSDRAPSSHTLEITYPDGTYVRLPLPRC